MIMLLQFMNLFKDLCYNGNLNIVSPTKIGTLVCKISLTGDAVGKDVSGQVYQVEKLCLKNANLL